MISITVIVSNTHVQQHVETVEYTATRSSAMKADIKIKLTGTRNNESSSQIKQSFNMRIPKGTLGNINPENQQRQSFEILHVIEKGVDTITP